jgi:hypothetical protein
MNQLDRRTYLKTAGAATAGMIGLAGCASDNGDGDGTGGDGQTYGTLSTLVTDQPNDIGDFEELIVTIDGIWLKPAGGENGDGDENDDEDESSDDESETTPTNATATPTNETATPTDETATPTNETATPESGDEPETADEDADEDDSEEDDDSGRYYVEFDEPQQADLVQLQGGETQLVDETEVETGEYQFLQLDVANTEGVLAESGEQADVEAPGNAPLKFNTSFEIRADEETRFVADFAPHQTGQGKYIIRPVATGTQVLYGDEEYQPDEEDGGSGDSDDGESGDGDTGGSGNGGRRKGGQRDETETSDGTETTTAQS